MGPTPLLTMLGIELDSLAQVAHLPADKLQVLQDLIRSWLPCKWCFRQELESLIGHLHHAAKIVWPGRTFLRRMIDLLCCFRTKDHPIRLNQEIYRNLLWWHHFLDQWHGVSFWLFPGLSPGTDLEVSSPVHWVLGPFSKDSGSMALGLFLNNRSPLPARNYFPWLWQPLSGDLSSARGMFCFALIMVRLSIC